MSTRYERRKARREVRAKLKDHRVRKILADELKRGGAGTETYSVRNDQTGEITHFNISAMRGWAETHGQRLGTPPNLR